MAALIIVTAILIYWMMVTYQIPSWIVIKLALVCPFLFFLPGFFVLRRFPVPTSVSENIILSIFVSLALNGIALDVVEKTRGGLPPLTIAMAIGVVNGLTLLLALTSHISHSDHKTS